MPPSPKSAYKNIAQNAKKIGREILFEYLS
jgi:hypothetical protein